MLTHTVCAIIEAEAAGTPDAAAAAAQGADLAGAAAGVMHNLLHPALRAWNTRAQHQALLAAIAQVFRMVRQKCRSIPLSFSTFANPRFLNFALGVGGAFLHCAEFPCCDRSRG